MKILDSRLFKAIMSILVLIIVYQFIGHTVEKIWDLHFLDHPLIFTVALPFTAAFWIIRPIGNSFGLEGIPLVTGLFFVLPFFLYYLAISLITKLILRLATRPKSK